MKVDNAESYLIFLLAAIASIVAWSNSYAQQSVTYEQYTNETYDVEIKYPSDWEVDSTNYNEGNTRYTTVVGFYSLLEDVNDPYSDSVEITSDQIPYKKIDLNLYMDETIDTYKNGVKGFHLISSSQDATLAGHPAYKITWTQKSNDENPISLKRTEIGAIFEDKNSISVTYNAAENSYENYLPIFNEMVESFSTAAETSAQQDVAYDTYTSDTYGIEIKYPSDWNVNRTDYEVVPGFNGVVEFTSGLTDIKDNYDEAVRIAQFQAPFKKLTIGELMDGIVTGMKDSDSFHLLSSSQDATLAGLPAYKVTYTEQADNGTPIKGNMMGALVGDNNGLIIFYAAAQDTYENYLPIFNEMVESFKIGAEGDTPITSTSTEDQDMTNISESTASTDTETGALEKGTETTETESTDTDTETGSLEFQGVSSPAGEGLQSYKNDYFGIRKLLYPDGWSVSENETTIQFSLPSVGKSSQDIYIYTYLTENRTLEDFAVDDYNYYQSKPEEMSIIEFKPIKLKGNQSAQLEIIGHFQESELYKELLVSTVKNDLLYVFDYFAPTDEYAKYISTVTNMIKSLDLTTESEVGSSEEISEPPAFLSPL